MSKSVSRRRPFTTARSASSGEEIEDEGVPAGIAAPPLGDELAAERRVDEQQVVVLGRIDRAVRCRQQRERRKDDEGNASKTRTAAGRHELDPAEQHRQHRGQRRRPVDVAPDDEQREHEIDAPARVSSLGGEQPDETREEREREDLCPDREGPRSRQQHRKEREQDRPRPAAEPAGGHRGDCKRPDGERGDDDREQAVSSERV